MTKMGSVALKQIAVCQILTVIIKVNDSTLNNAHLLSFFKQRMLLDHAYINGNNYRSGFLTSSNSCLFDNFNFKRDRLETLDLEN